jgi:general secretion pathway protein D
VKVGEPFEVVLRLSSDVPLRGIPLEIGFPTQLVEVLNVSEGTYFQQAGSATSFTSVINAQTGRVGASAMRQDTTTAKGRMDLVKLQLKAKAAGTVDLYVTSLKPIGVPGIPSVGELPVLRINAK